MVGRCKPAIPLKFGIEMDWNYSGKVVLVTGATSGMGKAVAEAFARAGANVVLSGRDEARGKALEDQLPNSIFIPGDISTPQANAHLVEAALARFGGLDVISLNAGVLGIGSAVDAPLEVWEQTLNTNLSAIFYMAKYAMPELSKNPGASMVINASIAAFKSFPNHPAYCASKAGAVALAKQLALDYGPAVRVNAICPGPVDTPLLWESAAAFPDPKTAVEKAGKATLMKRLGTPEDVAKLTLFLASDQASWMTGSAVTLDGGILNK